MTLRKKGISRVTRSWHHGAIVLAGCLLLSGRPGRSTAARQRCGRCGPTPERSSRAGSESTFGSSRCDKESRRARSSGRGPIAAPGKQSAPYTTPSGVRRITLEEAQQMARLCQWGIPWLRPRPASSRDGQAKTRAGARSPCSFPSIGSMF